MTSSTGWRRGVAGALVAGVLLPIVLGACTADGPDVDSRRATMHTDTTAAGPPSTAASEATIDETVPGPRATDAVDTTAPSDTSAPTDSAGPPDTTGGTVPTVNASTGVSGVGDELFPDLGNPGIDVDHYDIDLTFDHDTNEIDATATLTVTATADLEEFTLDAVGLDVSAVTVDDREAGFDNDDPELRITPADTVRNGDSFDVAVTYSAKGHTGTISAGQTAGWFETDTGSFVLNEPDGARTWLPSNDHPSDKATYHFTIRVPAGVAAAANGALVKHMATAAGEVWEWDQQDPMTTYVMQLMTGSLTVVDATGPDGLPLINVIQAGDENIMQPFIDETAQEIDFFDDFFGPFPFTSYGIAMTDGFIGGAMEEEGRSLFSVGDFLGGGVDSGTALLLSHELTHQWFGDAVSPARWKDIWLNESFATYGEWMWIDHAGYRSLEDSARGALAQRQHSSNATGDPDIPGLFGFEVYEGGATVLHALRKTVGDDTFFEILRTWVQSNVDTSRTSADFIDLSSKLAGEDLTDFFDTWLYSVNLPPTYPP